MNLNYLKESDIQLFHRECKRIGVDADWENILGGGKEYIRLKMNTKFTPNRFDGSVVYKMLFHRNKRYKRAYRSYDLKKVSSLKVVSYELGVLSKSDDEFKEGEVWRLQNKEDSNGFVWRSKNSKGELPENNFSSADEDGARSWAMDEVGGKK